MFRMRSALPAGTCQVVKVFYRTTGIIQRFGPVIVLRKGGQCVAESGSFPLCFAFRNLIGRDILYLIIYAHVCEKKKGDILHTLHTLASLPNGEGFRPCIFLPCERPSPNVAIFMVTRNVGESICPCIQVYQKERPLNTFDLSSGNNTPDKVRRLELKLGRISTVALLLPCGTVILTWADIPTPITLIDR